MSLTALRDHDVSRLMADTIKTLSDQGVNTTVVLVGVADDVGQLVTEHESIERGLTQVPMPRMSGAELTEIVRRGLKSVDMTIDDDAVNRITALSQGLPHYTHLLSQEASRSAVWQDHSNVEINDVIVAMRKAVERSPHSLAAKYHSATSTPRAKTLYPAVLLAAALAQGDELGYVAAVDIREPLRAITKKAYEIPAFSPHRTRADRGGSRLRATEDRCSEAVPLPLCEPVGAAIRDHAGACGRHGGHGRTRPLPRDVSASLTPAAVTAAC